MKVARFVETMILNNEHFTILIDKSIIDQLKSQLHPHIEQGGTLYGYKLLEREEYRITGYTKPMRKDKKTPIFFGRRDKEHFKVINEMWKKDMFTMYLGDWHTHPVGKANPSSVDLETFKDISLKAKTISNVIIYFLITPTQFRVFIYDRKGDFQNTFYI